SKLIPDQLFGLDYGGTYRVFALEVDRGTEPKSSPSARKSWARSIVQYRQVIEQGLQKTHYGLKAPLLVLWVFSTASRQAKFLEMVGALPEPVAARFLTAAARQTGFAPAAYSGPALYHAPWQRSGHSAVKISVG
ncbi:MAG TPA: replication-relaxation family protein, partial [Paracoccaceae bacterium]|nr:replication-relaxation family protein [Paracoccaceae bacterium]